MRKYLAFFKISLKKSLEYRGRLLVWFFWETWPAIIMLFFWTAAFKTRNNIGTYDYYSLVIYYLVVMFSRNLVLTFPEVTFQQEVYRGEINTYLLRPANLINLKLFYSLAYKLLKLLYLIPALIISYFLFIGDQKPTISFNLSNSIFFLLSCGISFYLYFLIKILVGITSFWFTEIEWLIDVVMLIFWFFGGLLLPLDLLPRFMQTFASFLPFKYIFYIPSQGLLGKLSLNQMCISFVMQLFWLMLFFILVKKIYKAGLKVYSAFGG